MATTDPLKLTFIAFFPPLASLCGMRYLSSLTRGQIFTPCIGSSEP